MMRLYFYYVYHAQWWGVWFMQSQINQEEAKMFQEYIDRGLPGYEYDGIVIEEVQS